jgi:hypothetical protein
MPAQTLELADDLDPKFVWPGTPAEVARLRFREFSAHMRETIHREASAYRVQEKNLTIIFCRICQHQWFFTDVALRAGGAHVLDWLWENGQTELVEAVLNHEMPRGAWARVLLGFLDET